MSQLAEIEEKQQPPMMQPATRTRERDDHEHEPSNNNDKQNKMILPVFGTESIMAPKEHGTSATPVQAKLRWGVNRKLADRICNYNRHWAEPSGYFIRYQRLLRRQAMQELFGEELQQEDGNHDSWWWQRLRKQQQHGKTSSTGSSDGTGKFVFYDSNTGQPLFVLKKKKKHGHGRSWEEFWQESKDHGWPSFRDDEVVWQNVRILSGGECVSIDGTHLGHLLPDAKGNRYCINLVSIAGNQTIQQTQTQQRQA